MALNIALINMPFGFHIYPSIQLGTLSTLLKANDWLVRSRYLNLHFAHQLGIPIYNQLCEKRFLVGEWLRVDEEGAAEDAVQQLEELGILYGEKSKYLTLALPHNANL